MRIVGIVGSLRRGSVNRMLFEQVRGLLPEGAELRCWDELRAVPPFDEDTEAEPAPVVTGLRAAIREADAVLVITPEYNGSVPGQLKNALDWASRPYADNCLRDKPAIVLGASPSPGGSELAQAQVRHVLTRIGARVQGEVLALPHAHTLFDADGVLADDELRARLAALLADALAVRA